MSFEWFENSRHYFFENPKHRHVNQVNFVVTHFGPIVHSLISINLSPPPHNYFLIPIDFDFYLTILSRSLYFGDFVARLILHKLHPSPGHRLGLLVLSTIQINHEYLKSIASFPFLGLFENYYSIPCHHFCYHFHYCYFFPILFLTKHHHSRPFIH